MNNPFDLGEFASDTYKAGVIIDLSVISLLVDKGILSPNELIERIERLHNKLSAAQSAGVLERLTAVLDEIRNQPGATS